MNVLEGLRNRASQKNRGCSLASPKRTTKIWRLARCTAHEMRNLLRARGEMKRKTKGWQTEYDGDGIRVFVVFQYLQTQNSGSHSCDLIGFGQCGYGHLP